MTTFTQPAPLVVYCTVAPTERNRLEAPYTHRVGPAFTLEGAKKVIADDKEAMRNTLGGLIDAPGAGGRTYRVFEAKWTEVTT